MSQAGFPKISFHHSAHQLAAAIVVVSIIFGLFGVAGVRYLALIPLAVVYDWEFWRPFTALLVAPGPMEVVFGAVIVYSIGGSLEYSLGKKRFLTLAVGIPLVGSVLTVLLSVLLPGLFAQVLYFGASSIITTVWILYGIRAEFSRQQLNFWGIPLTGKNFALIGVGFVVLQGVFSNFVRVLPELFSAGLCYAYMFRGQTSNPLRSIEMAYYNWKLKRLKEKRGLHVVPPQQPRKSNDDDIQIH
jgi:membrane associated rhomboid family serine protease